MESRDEIFVFGSNLAGKHGAGSALYARRYRGAIYGRGEGMQGQSYGIPTKDSSLARLPLHEIRKYVNAFLNYAALHPESDFRVVEIGCGLAGYTPKDIAPMFIGCSLNVHLPSSFLAWNIQHPPSKEVEDLKTSIDIARREWEDDLIIVLREIGEFGRAVGKTLGETSYNEARAALRGVAVEKISQMGTGALGPADVKRLAGVDRRHNARTGK